MSVEVLRWEEPILFLSLMNENEGFVDMTFYSEARN